MSGTCLLSFLCQPTRARCHLCQLLLFFQNLFLWYMTLSQETISKLLKSNIIWISIFTQFNFPYKYPGGIPCSLVQFIDNKKCIPWWTSENGCGKIYKQLYIYPSYWQPIKRWCKASRCVKSNIVQSYSGVLTKTACAGSHSEMAVGTSQHRIARNYRDLETSVSR